jgi:hypothetical protein
MLDSVVKQRRVQVGEPVMARRLQLHAQQTDTDKDGRDVVAPSKPPAHLAIESGISAGFQMACAAGPLCQDPLWGVAMELSVALAVDSFNFSTDAWDSLDLRESVAGPVSGQVHVALHNAGIHSAGLCDPLLHDLFAV